MRIYTVWITRREGPDGEHTSAPELVEAWDEDSVEENPRGWNRACDRATESIGDDLYDSRIIILTVVRDDIEALFEAHTVTARVVPHEEPARPNDLTEISTWQGDMITVPLESSSPFTVPVMPDSNTNEGDVVHYTTAQLYAAMDNPRTIFSWAHDMPEDQEEE